MDHPFIVNAFANAKQRTAEGQAPIVYLSFKRSGIFYKDTYCILTGTWAEVVVAIENAYTEVNKAKQEEHFCRGDHNNLLDTPFDTWCSGKCKRFSCDDQTQCDGQTQCDDQTHIKCGSNWLCTEHDSKTELEEYLNNIKLGYYPSYSIEYM